MKTIFLDLAKINTRHCEQTIRVDNVLTIGNFDGVHLGHQAMLKQLQDTAKQLQMATMVMIFEPQPREYFAQLKAEPESAPARLTSQSEKLTLLAELGIDTVVVAKFDEAFRSLTATQFADMLTHHLKVKALVLGDDFKFGQDRTGDSEFLRGFGLPVTNLHTITANHASANKAVIKADSIEKVDDRISSTRIRELLQLGHLAAANSLLNRDYSMTGKVIKGDQIGRTLNFPTANIELNRLRPALHGVYGVDVVIVEDENESDSELENSSNNHDRGTVIVDAFESIAQSQQNGVKGLRPNSLFGTANIGVRPSVDKPREWRLEVFFPEFSGNLYGKTLNVRFLHHLHDERKYDGLEALKAGIQQDVVDLLQWRNSAVDSQ